VVRSHPIVSPSSYHPALGSSGQQISDCSQSQANSHSLAVPETITIRPVKEATEKIVALLPIPSIVL